MWTLTSIISVILISFVWILIAFQSNSRLCIWFCRHMILRYDAIICDPPYGIRAGARKSGTYSISLLFWTGLERRKFILWEETCSRETHFISLKLSNIILMMLLQIFWIWLQSAWRLVDDLCSCSPPEVSILWDSALRVSSYTQEAAPRHPCLTLISNSDEKLSGMLHRRLITMEKTMEYDPSYAIDSFMNLA